MAKQPDPVENLPAPPGGPAPAAKPSLLPVIIIVLAIPLITIGMWEFVMMPSIEKMVKEHGGGAAAEGAEEHAEEKKEGGHGEGERGESVLTYEVKDVVANLSVPCAPATSRSASRWKAARRTSATSWSKTAPR
jgi:hypothetical protein